MCDCCTGYGPILRAVSKEGFDVPRVLSTQGSPESGDVPPPPPSVAPRPRRGTRLVASGGATPGTGLRPSLTAAAGGAVPERIFLARVVHTLDEAAPRADAVAVSEGRIVFVGGRKEVLARAGPQTQVFDLGSRTLLPGFIDPHVHAIFAMLSDWLDVGPFTTSTVDEASEKLRRAAGLVDKGVWVKAKMMDFALMPGRAYDRHVLDEICPENPVAVLEANGHVMYLNSLALELAGINEESSDPPQARYIRDADGKLTGRLEEPPALVPVLAVIGTPPPAALVQFIKGFFQEAAEKGCTALHDCGIGAMSADNDLMLLDAALANNPPLRFAGMLVSTHMDKWREMGLRPGPRSDKFTITGIKAWSDGSVAARTGFFRENYLDCDTRGDLNYSPEEIERVIRAAHEDGWQLGVHANGDAAIDVTLDAYDKVLSDLPRKDHRHRIEHTSFCRPEHIQSMKRLGISPSFLVNHVHFWGKAYQDGLVGKERTDFLDPCASALRAGLRISMHSDYCVTPIDPLHCIQTAVVRNMRDGGGILNEAERISPLQAIRAMTLDAAWQCQIDHICGSLEVGKVADFVVLEEDPLRVDPMTIAKIPIHSTWLDGKQRVGAPLAPEPPALAAAL